jgi:hypothetical protein
MTFAPLAGLAIVNSTQEMVNFFGTVSVILRLKLSLNKASFDI